MAQLSQAIAELDQQIEGLDTALARLDAQISALDKELQHAPPDDGIKRTVIHIEAARKAVSLMRRKLTDAEARLAERRSEWARQVSRRNESAQDFKISEWVEKLAELQEFLQAYRLELAALWPAVSAYFETVSQQKQVQERHEMALRNRDERDERKQAQTGLTAEAASRYDTLESTLGKTVDEVRKRLQDAAELTFRVHDEKQNADKAWNDQKVAHALAAKEVEDQSDDVKVKEATRSGCLAGLVNLLERAS